MNNCGTCKHWNKAKGAEDSWDARAAQMGVCEAVKQMWNVTDPASRDLSPIPGWFDCDDIDPRDEYMKARTKALREHKAVVLDGSEYRADLFTTDEFGCVLWSAPQPL